MDHSSIDLSDLTRVKLDDKLINNKQKALKITDNKKIKIWKTVEPIVHGSTLLKMFQPYCSIIGVKSTDELSNSQFKLTRLVWTDF